MQSGMKLYAIEEFAKFSQTRIVQKGLPLSLQHLLIDSRLLLHPSNTVFFAIKSAKNDGHNFIDKLYNTGVRAFVISSASFDCSPYREATFFLAHDCVQGLQALARAHRRLFSLPVVAITGSNGKTIVKEWLRSLLSQKMNIVASPKSYNSQIGVPLSVWQLSGEHELGIFEAGISKVGEMERLEVLIQPDIGVFTNIGTAHSENFEDQQHKISEKLKLFVHAKSLVCSADQGMLYEEIVHFAQSNNIRLFCWGRAKGADVQLKNVNSDQHQTHITYEYKGNLYQMAIPFRDEASLENALHCLSSLLLLGMSPDWIHEQMAELNPVALRLEQKNGRRNTIIINDSYNSDLESLRIALDFLDRQSQVVRKILILSDIQESGFNDAALYNEVQKIIDGISLQQIICIGEKLFDLKPIHGDDVQYFKCTENFLSSIHLFDFHDEAILLKGARNFRFELISKMLEAQTHDTVMEVNLDALVHNLNYFRSLLPQGQRIMAMVKANAYGMGSVEIAHLLDYHHIDILAVAYADEGVELRKAGISLPIMVMNPETDALSDMLHYNLEPEIYSIRQFLNFAQAAKKQIFYTDRVAKVHIKLDTGMRRLGFQANELKELAKQLKSFPFIRVESIFSHLAASDEAKHDDFTMEQLSVFSSSVTSFQKEIGYKAICHILNTAGICRFPDFAFDMVRLGIGLYGVSPLPEVQKKLRPVSRLKTVVSQIKSVKKGESVGYSRSYTADRDVQIAIIPIGYADGLNRRLSNKGCFVTHGVTVPIIGNICMDMCMVDVSHVPQIQEGDEIIIYGPELDISLLAKKAGTIAYELLTSVSHRVKRVYYHE